MTAETFASLHCFIMTTAIWHSYHQLITYKPSTLYTVDFIYLLCLDNYVHV
jgi:hypothetical protein